MLFSKNKNIMTQWLLKKNIYLSMPLKINIQESKMTEQVIELSFENKTAPSTFGHKFPTKQRH